VRLAERDHAGREQALDRRSGVIGDAAAPALRSGGGRVPREMQQVLERDRQAVQRAAGKSRRALEVRGPGRGDGVVAVHVDERVQALVERRDPREAGVDDFAGRSLARRQQAGEVGQRMEREVGGHGARVSNRAAVDGRSAPA
jgi:hypothetical protein